MSSSQIVANAFTSMAWNLVLWFLLPALLTCLPAQIFLPKPFNKLVACGLVLAWMYFYIAVGSNQIKL